MVTVNGVITNNCIYKSIENIPLSIITRSIEINKFWGKILKDTSIANIAHSGNWVKVVKGEIIAYMLTWLFSGIFFILSGIYLSIGFILVRILTFFNNFGHFLSLWWEIQETTKILVHISDSIKTSLIKMKEFWKLQDGPDLFATTLKIITIKLIRIEKIEHSIGKWNIFDSLKYLNSLKRDIIVALRSLRGFLETKRIELVTSQQELSQVRVQVGGTSENRDLASARTEPLIVELTENIGKLDIMIGKME